MPISIVNAQFLSLPTFSANAHRYRHDVTAAAQLRNRTVSHFMQCLPFYPVAGDGLFVRQVDTNTAGRDAQFYVNNGLTAIAATNMYVPTNTVPLSTADAFFGLKHLIAQADVRDESALLLSDQYDQTEFQKDAIVLAVNKLFDETAATGDQTANPEQYNGLGNIIAQQNLGVAQAALNLASNPLADWRSAMNNVKSHNGRCDLIVGNLAALAKAVHVQEVRGETPDFRWDDALQQWVYYYNGVRFCVLDFIGTTGTSPDEVTQVFFMSLGAPNGVFGIVAAKAPELRWSSSHREDSPFTSWQGSLYAGLASASSDALRQLVNWNVSIV